MLNSMELRKVDLLFCWSLCLDFMDLPWSVQARNTVTRPINLPCMLEDKRTHTLAGFTVLAIRRGLISAYYTTIVDVARRNDVQISWIW